MDLTEPFLGSQGWLSGKPTVQERPSHVGPWFTRRPLGRRFLFVSMRFLLVQGDTREVTDRYHAHHLLALSHREMPEVPGQHDFQGSLNRGFGAHRNRVWGHPLS